MRRIAYIQRGTRLFSPSRPRLASPICATSQLHSQRPRGLFTEILHSNVNAAHELLLFIHNYSHLPWLLSIPLTALVVRTTVALPLQIWSLKQRDKMLHLRPILNAKRWFRRKAILDEANANKVMLVPAEVDHLIGKDDYQDRQETYKRLKVYRFASFAPMAQIPVWLAVMESLRRMVGAEGGVLTILHRLMNPAGQDFPVPIEESMATEGGLWFSNLLIADPHLALPFILAAVMYTNITWGWKVATNEELLKMPVAAARKARMVRGLKKGLQIVAISLAPTTLASNIPSGLLLYWISSTTFATLQTRAFAKFWPPPQVPAQCANYGVAPAASPDAATRWQIIPKAQVAPDPASTWIEIGNEKPTKTAKPKRQIKRYIKE